MTGGEPKRPACAVLDILQSLRDGSAMFYPPVSNPEQRKDIEAAIRNILECIDLIEAVCKEMRKKGEAQ